MEIRKPIANDDAPATGGGIEDHVQPFMLESSQLRGRIVRLPHAVDQIVKAHHYPDAIARLLGEALCLTTLLAGMLKFDGVFTFQAKGGGIVKTLVCDMTNDGVLRGYAGYDKEIFQDGKDYAFNELLSDGYLAFTVDQAESTDRYQGIVALEGDTLTDCVRNYFLQSEQINTGFISHLGKDAEGNWIGGALMLQQLPPEGGHPHGVAESEEDDWRRSMMLMQTLKADEILQRDLPLNELLYRLFHEEGVRVFTPIGIRKGCRCSADRIRGVLDNLSADDKMEYVENGVISVTCEFCNTLYEFPAGEQA